MATLEVHELTKRYGGRRGEVLAVDRLSFTVEPGVTGLLGGNGAGKSTTLRMLVGLIHPTSGSALIDGVPYRRLRDPLRTVGALVETTTAHPGRSARDHLRVVATAARIPRARADEVLELVGLAGVAGRRAQKLSLGMRQRLALATALLGDPQVLVLDEPTNGLDPEGVRWLRDLLRGYGQQGRTVIVSSHLLSEVSLTVDRVLAIDHGRLILDDELGTIRGRLHHGIAVRTPDTGHLLAALSADGICATATGPDEVLVRDATPEQVGRAVAAAGVVVYELQRVDATLEDVFLTLTTPETAR